MATYWAEDEIDDKWDGDDREDYKYATRIFKILAHYSELLERNDSPALFKDLDRVSELLENHGYSSVAEGKAEAAADVYRLLAKYLACHNAGTISWRVVDNPLGVRSN